MKKPTVKKVTAKKATHRKTAVRKKPAHHTVSRAVASARARKAAVTRKKRKATLGGQCAWMAFGVRKPWYRRGPARLETVAKRAGYVRGMIQPGCVVGVHLNIAHMTGYHAARVQNLYDNAVVIDLWGASAVVARSEIEESFIPAL